jgi:SAM-dependent methyltransferase
VVELACALLILNVAAVHYFATDRRIMKALDAALYMVNSGGSQVFLGAPWVPLSIRMVPRKWRKRIALEWLAISPHYFFRTAHNNNLGHIAFLTSEWERNKRSRQLLADQVVKPYLSPDFTVLDYGCGPGWLAAAASTYARRVVACDISKGVLECARALNARSNLEYLEVHQTGLSEIEDSSVNLIYSFAVVQHVEDDVFQKILDEFQRVLKCGSQVLCHIVLRGGIGWRTEVQWREDRSIMGRTRWVAGLHCFARDSEQVTAMVEASGFCEIVLDPIQLSGQDDLAHQHLLRFRKPR